MLPLRLCKLGTRQSQIGLCLGQLARRLVVELDLSRLELLNFVLQRLFLLRLHLQGQFCLCIEVSDGHLRLLELLFEFESPGQRFLSSCNLSLQVGNLGVLVLATPMLRLFFLHLTLPVLVEKPVKCVCCILVVVLALPRFNSVSELGVKMTALAKIAFYCRSIGSPQVCAHRRPVLRLSFLGHVFKLC